MDKIRMGLEGILGQGLCLKEMLFTESISKNENKFNLLKTKTKKNKEKIKKNIAVHSHRGSNSQSRHSISRISHNLNPHRLGNRYPRKQLTTETCACLPVCPVYTLSSFNLDQQKTLDFLRSK